MGAGRYQGAERQVCEVGLKGFTKAEVSMWLALGDPQPDLRPAGRRQAAGPQVQVQVLALSPVPYRTLSETPTMMTLT